MNTSTKVKHERISVIGCPGAGKTTFARELAEITKLPLCHLDLIYHDQTHEYKTNKKSWRERVLTETKRRQWIMDGNYKSTFDIRLPESDMIIFLDYPTHLSIMRAIKRRFQFRKKVRTDMPSTWKESLGKDFFMFILNFNHKIAPQIRSQLQSYKDKEVVILKSPHLAEVHLSTIRTKQ